MIKQIRKRDGRVVKFDGDKIVEVIKKAAEATGEFEKREAERLGEIVMRILQRANGKHIPTVEQVQDIVEQVLMAAGHYSTAKSYILYRSEQTKERKVRAILGVEDDLGLTLNSLKVLEKKRYLRHDDQNRVMETPGQMVRRVARAMAKREKTKRKRKKYQDLFFEVISRMEFVPAGCYFRGAGTKSGNLTNCFVLPVEDSMEGIFDGVKWTALVHQKGGGSGFNFSNLRPKGDYVSSSGGFSSGPVSFMRVFDAATRQVMQGGFLQGANMGILNVDHPDVFEFITCKAEDEEITNFNISVGVTDKFMRAVKKDREWKLVNPRNGKVVQTMAARKLFDAIVTMAWKSGDPGMIYLDAINKDNSVMESMGPIRATNPCGEQPLHDFDCCNLGSINLAKFVVDGEVDWKRLGVVVKLAVRFLDSGVDEGKYPIPQIRKMARSLRRIGLGVMGWADMLFQLRVRYDSKAGVELARRVAKFIQEKSWEESERLAGEKGVFPAWKESEFKKCGPVTKKLRKVRNVAVTTIAPTGTISMVADCSSGIEPVFALSFNKNVVDDGGLTYTNKYFEEVLSELYENGVVGRKQEILREVQETGSVQGIRELPEWVRETFRVAYDISPEWHVKMQAAWQKYTDNAVSKTINFQTEASIEDVEEAYIKAWELGCKGITVYRDKSKSVQVLSVGDKKRDKKKKQVMQSQVRIEPLTVRAEVEQRETKCPECAAELVFKEGCFTCDSCGWSKCSL